MLEYTVAEDLRSTRSGIGTTWRDKSLGHSELRHSESTRMGIDQPSGQQAAGQSPAQAPITAPPTTATRQRLQKLFEHAQRCVDKKDHDYANKLFTQCVVEDPSNLIYLQAFLGNLESKFGEKKKGSRLAGMKVKSLRNTLTKAAGKGDWPVAIQAGCDALALSPWDPATLLELAKAYNELGILECQLYLMRWGLGADAKDVAINRQAAQTLERMGQFDQAIACWTRVTQAIPNDEQALQAISRLSVEKTIHEGGYDPSLLQGDSAEGGSKSSVASYSRHAEEDDGLTPEERLRAALESDPSDADSCLHLADILIHSARSDEAEQLLERGRSAAGAGDLRFLERIESIQIRKAHEQLQIAQQRHEQNPTDESAAQLLQFRRQANQVELEIYAAKSDRDPSNTRLKHELGLRFKRAGKVKEAITTLQGASGDSKRRAQVLLDLGECFQKIEQYKLALSNYEQAIDACDSNESDVYRLALYRAGVLSTGLREMDRAERHLTELAGLDYGYRDVADRLDKLAELRNSG